MGDEHTGSGDGERGDDGLGDDEWTQVGVPQSFAVGQLERAAKALRALGDVYNRVGATLRARALVGDAARIYLDEVTEHTADTIHVLNGQFRALRRIIIEPDNPGGTEP